MARPSKIAAMLREQGPMKKQLRGLILILVGLSCALGSADEAEKAKPKPDLVPIEIVVPAGIKPGMNNQVKILVDNTVKDSEVTGKVPVELVVISAQTGERLTYKAEVDGMGYHQKKEALFGEVRVPADTNTVRLLAVVDRDATIEEANKDNNRRLYQVTVLEPAAAPAPAQPQTEETPKKDEDKASDSAESPEKADGKGE